MWVEMYAEKDENTNQWHVLRIAHDGSLSVTPFFFKTKDSAISYIMAHDLKPNIRLNEN